MICEGGKTDVPVLELIFNHHFKQHIEQKQVEFVIQGVSKKDIFTRSDVLLADMVQNQGVKRALIVWDLLPTGVKIGVSSQWSEKPSRKEQRQTLLSMLCDSEHLPHHLRNCARCLHNRYGFVSGYDDIDPSDGKDNYLKLVCVCYALDGWLLADPAVLRWLASSKDMRKKGRLDKYDAEDLGRHHPENCKQPAVELGRYFGRGRNTHLKFYNKVDHNKVIIQAYLDHDNLSTLRKECPSFARVLDAIEGWMRQCG